MPMRALITGIKGFVGQYLLEELKKNNIGTFGISRKEEIKGNLYKGDILDLEGITNIIKSIRPDVVFHLAGFTSVKDSWEKPDEAMRLNKGGTENLYKAIERIDINIKVILASSAEVYGNPAKLPISETDPVHPVNPYSKSKLAQEEVANNNPKIKTIICRSFHHTGPRQLPIFAIPSFAKQVAMAEAGLQNEILVGNLDAQRDFTDVRDVVRAYRMLAQSDNWGQTYNICSGKTWSIKQVLDILLQYSKKNIIITADPSKIRPNDIPVLQGNNAKIKNDTEWELKIPFSTTIKDTLEYWRGIITYGDHA